MVLSTLSSYSSSSSATDVSAHEFGALNTLLFVVILGLCILAAYLIKINSFYYFPESAAAIFIGLIVGGLARVVYPSLEELEFLAFQSELFFFLLLPPIIFEAAYSLNKLDFFSNFWTISLYAVCGTIISTFLIGYVVYFIALRGFVHIDTSSPMEALLFGALISSIDPVATLSIMGNTELNCDPLLYSLVFGESVLNDAVAIVLFKTFLSFYDSGATFTSQSILPILLSFTYISLGSLFCGVCIGLLCCYLCKQTQLKQYPEFEIALLLLFAYGSYAVAEAVGLSGIMSLFFNGIILSHYNSHNLSTTSQVTAHTIFKSFAVLCDYFVYLFIGMGMFTGKFKHWNLSFSVLCLLLCLLMRFFNIIPLSFIANLFRKQRLVSMKMQVVMWFAGLRGAISFALSMQIPGDHRDVYISTTLSIVIFTTVVFGGLTEPMLTHMGMRNTVYSLSSTGGSSGSGGGDENSSNRRIFDDADDDDDEDKYGNKNNDKATDIKINSGNTDSNNNGISHRVSSNRNIINNNKTSNSSAHYELTIRTTDDDDEYHEENGDNTTSANSSDDSTTPLGATTINTPCKTRLLSSFKNTVLPIIDNVPSSPHVSYLRRLEHQYMSPLFGGPSVTTATATAYHNNHDSSNRNDNN